MLPVEATIQPLASPAEPPSALYAAAPRRVWSPARFIWLGLVLQLLSLLLLFRPAWVDLCLVLEAAGLTLMSRGLIHWIRREGARAEPVRRTRPGAWASVLLVLAALIGAALWSQSVVIPGETAHCGYTQGEWFGVEYRGNQSGFVNWGMAPLCANEGFDFQHLPPGAHLSFKLAFWSNDNRSTHTWESLTIQPPYTLVSVSPNLPILILNSSAAEPYTSGGASALVTVTAPTLPGNYGLPAGSLVVD